MTGAVVLVGTSLLTNIQDGKVAGADGVTASQIRESVNDAMGEVTLALERTKAVGWIADQANGRRHNGTIPNSSSAEFSTLGGRPNMPDWVVLAASDTVDGLASAAGVACVLADEPRFYDSAEEFHREPVSGEPFRNGAASVVRIAGLRDVDDSEFSKVPKELAYLLAATDSAVTDDRREVHVTGGFKVVIPLVVGILGVVGGHRPAVFCRYERTESTRQIAVPPGDVGDVLSKRMSDLTMDEKGPFRGFLFGEDYEPLDLYHALKEFHDLRRTWNS